MRSRGRRRIWIIALLVGLYAAVGYLALPPLVRPQLEDRLSRELGRRVAIGAVRIDPFALSIALDRVQILDAEGSEPFAGWRRLYLNIDPLQSFRGDWVVGQAVLVDFRGALEFDENGGSNVSDLLERFARERDQPEVREPAAKPGFLSRPWRISRLRVAGARVDLIDRSRREQFRTLIGPVDFTLVEFRTAGGQGAPYRFEARTESGELLQWTGSLTARPFASAGEWRIENLLLSKYAPYFDDRFNLLLTSGKLSMSGGYDVSLASEGRRILVSDGRAELTKLNLLERATGQPWLDVNGAEIAGISADLLARRVSLGSVQVNGGRLAVRRDASGALNLLALGAVPDGQTTAAQPSATEPPAPAWIEVNASEVALRDFTVHWQDATVPKPVELELTGLNARLKDFTLAPGATTPIELTFGIKPQGTGRANGRIGFRPLQTELELELAWMPLPPLSAYLERVAPVRVTRGGVSVRGQVGLSFEDGTPHTTFYGGGRFEEVAFTGFVHDEPLAGFSHLALNDLAITTSPRLGFSLGAVTLSAPYAHMIVDRDGILNLAPLWRADAASAMADRLRASARAAEVPSFELEIARLAIEGGEVVFEDRSFDPQVQMAVSQIGGVLRDVSSLNPARGDLQLRGFVDGGDPLLLKGRFNPLVPEPFADLVFEADGIDLGPLEPYLARYAGHALEGGDVSVEGQLKLVEQQLDLRSTVTLHELTLGPQTESPHAIDLPVALAVSLLKDASGKLVLELPVEGNLQDPQFSVSRTMGQTVTSLLARAATSPFAMIGSEFGGGGEDLRFHRFPLGDTTPTPDSLERLAVMRRALAARPALQLVLEASYDPGERYELKRRELDRLIRQRVWDRLRAEDANLPPVDELLISSGNRANAIIELFYEKFAGVRAPWRRGGEVSRAEATTAAAAAAEVRPPPGTNEAAAPPMPRLDEPERPAAVASSTAAPREMTETLEAAAPERAEPEAEEERPGLVRRAWNLATLKGLRDRWWGDDEEEPEEQTQPETAAQPAPPDPAPPPPALAAAAPRTGAASATGHESRQAVAPSVDSPQTKPADVPLDVSVSEMEQRLIDSMDVGEEALVRLAEARAERVKQILTENEGVAPERVQIAKIDPKANANGARVTLELR